MRLLALSPALLLIFHTLAEEARTTSSVTLTTTTIIPTTITLTLSRGRLTTVTSQEQKTETSVPSPSSTAAAMSISSALENTVLNSTNYYRTEYLASNLTWNTTLAAFAQNHAQGCIFQHSGGPYGENLAASYESPTLAIDGWASEEPLYDYSKRKFTERNGHFTQLVWQQTTDVGCANVQCDGDVKGEFLVCEYSPRGNIQGEFGANVRKAGMEGVDGKLGIGSGADGKKVGIFWAMVVVGGVLGLVMR